MASTCVISNIKSNQPRASKPCQFTELGWACSSFLTKALAESSNFSPQPSTLVSKATRCFCCRPVGLVPYELWQQRKRETSPYGRAASLPCSPGKPRTHEQRSRNRINAEEPTEEGTLKRALEACLHGWFHGMRLNCVDLASYAPRNGNEQPWNQLK